jgi:hypothetical protein
MENYFKYRIGEAGYEENVIEDILKNPIKHVTLWDLRTAIDTEDYSHEIINTVRDLYILQEDQLETFRELIMFMEKYRL